MNDYLSDLLERLASDEWLPAKPGEIARSDTHGISFMAHREAEQLTDETLVDELVAFLNKKTPSKLFQSGLWVLGCLLANVEHQTGRLALSSLFENSGLTPPKLTSMISAAEKCRLVEARKKIFELLEHKHYGVRSYAADYFIAIKDERGTLKLADLLVRDLLGVDKVIALGNLGYPSVIPYLEKVVARTDGSKRHSDIDMHGYSLQAIKEIKESTCS